MNERNSKNFFEFIKGTNNTYKKMFNDLFQLVSTLHNIYLCVVIIDNHKRRATITR